MYQLDFKTNRLPIYNTANNITHVYVEAFQLRSTFCFINKIRTINWDAASVDVTLSLSIVDAFNVRYIQKLGHMHSDYNS